MKWLLLFPFVVTAQVCDLEPSQLKQANTRQVAVDLVIDGDTVRLKDKRLVRFVGINTPEIDHKTGNSEPYAKQARDYLHELVQANQKIMVLRFDRETEDRHGRLLAHVFTRDGKNVQAQLIAKGLAVWITVPPNLAYLECYRQREQTARRSKTGIWSAQFRSPRSIDSLTRKDRGFQWISGKVTRVGQGKKYIWLNFGEQAAARVQKIDLQYFKNRNLSTLKGQTVTIKGWMFPYKKQLVMPLRHPASMEIEK